MLAFIFLLLITGISAVAPSDFQDITNNVQPPLYAHKAFMGNTINKNDLNVYLLTKLPFTQPNQLQGKNAILLNSYMHARQPYSAQLLRHLYQHIINNYQNTNLNQFLNNGIIIIFPFVNIDGYQKYMQTQPNKRQGLSQRKNLNLQGMNCLSYSEGGVDINRNFPYHFGTLSESSNPCKQQYRGKTQFSQSESIIFKELFLKFKILVAIDIHSYGNTWIYPYASDSTGSIIKQHKLYNFYEDIIRKLKNSNKIVESCIQSLKYVADGVYIDWALSQNALAFAYQIGLKFSKDSQIAQQINKSIPDFYTIFEKATPSFIHKVTQKQLYLQSTSLSDMTLQITINNNQPTTHILKTNAYSNFVFKQLITSVQITIMYNDKRGQTTYISASPNSLVMVAIITAWIVFFFICVLGCSFVKKQFMHYRMRKTELPIFNVDDSSPKIIMQ